MFSPQEFLQPNLSWKKANLCPKIENGGVQKPRLIVISAPSGGGKSTLCGMITREFSTITLSVSATTRAKRPEEVDTVHYHFLSTAAFQKKILAKEFIEHAKVHDNYYGTLRATVDKALEAGKHILFDIYVQGARSLLRAYPDRVLLVFVHPPSMEILEQRLIDRRSDSARSIERRLQNAYNELEWSKIFYYQITNDNLEKAYALLKDIILKECL